MLNKSEGKKVTKLTRMKIFLKKNIWRILVSGILTVFLIYASSLPSVGYTADIEVDKNSAKNTD
jgi:hypothetical protein